MQRESRLPVGIVSDVRFESLRASQVHTLEIIATHCHEAERDGSLIGACGGDELMAACEVSKATFWRHVNTLVRLGLLVVVSSGGIDRASGRQIGNIYGVPAVPGALDDRACRRRFQQMVLGEDGVRRPVVVAAGEQAELWPDRPEQGPKRAGETAPHLDETAPHLKTAFSGTSRRAPQKSEAPHGMDGMDGLYKDHSIDSVSRGGAAFWHGHLSREDLRSDERLFELYERAIAAGAIGLAEADRDHFFQSAEHALAVGDAHNPVGLFLWRIAQRDAVGVYVSAEVIERAGRRVKRLFCGEGR